MGNPIIRVMGTADLIAGFIILFVTALPRQVALLTALYLITKGGIFAYSGDKASFLDVFCGLYLIVASFGLEWPLLTILAGLWLLQKAIVSFF